MALPATRPMHISPTEIADAIDDAAATLSQHVSQNYSSKNAGFLSALGGKVVLDDDFMRPDCTLATGGNGLMAPTGQIYRSEGTVHADGSDAALIRSHRHVWADQTTNGSDPIRILDVGLTQIPNAVGGEFVFVPGEHNTQNAVIGCMPQESFNVASIQLAVYPEYWRLFWVLDSYQEDVFLVDFPTPLAVDGETRHQIFMRRDPATSTVVCECDGVTLCAWTDPKVNSSWGNHVGYQERLDAAGDGSVEWTHIAASAVESEPSGIDASLVIGGDVHNYVRTNLHDFSTEDLEIVFGGKPDGGWASGHLRALVSLWSGSALQSFTLAMYNTGKMILYMSADGKTNQQVSCPTAASDTSEYVKATYDSSENAVQFFESADGDTWTQLGTGHVSFATGGAPFAVPDYVPLMVGCRDLNSGFLYAGEIWYASVSKTIGGTPAAEADLSTIRSASWYDDYGNQWAITGSWTWSVAAS